MAVNSIDDVIPVADRGPDGLLDVRMGGELFAQPGLCPKTWLARNPSAGETPGLQWALEEVLSELDNRAQRVEASDIVSPLQLQRAVLTGAHSYVYFLNATSGSSDALYGAKSDRLDKTFRAQIKGLRPTLASGVRASAGSFEVVRA